MLNEIKPQGFTKAEKLAMVSMTMEVDPQTKEARGTNDSKAVM